MDPPPQVSVINLQNAIRLPTMIADFRASLSPISDRLIIHAITEAVAPFITGIVGRVIRPSIYKPIVLPAQQQ